MDIYLVGGAVRDELLGLPVKDRDWVVVGATPEQMIEAGYRQVGADFPVFLHPSTNEEYALARTERKQGHGYHGFTVYSAPDVTLEDDLRRRDLTVNAMARDQNGQLVDPFGGREDLERRQLRHVSDAFDEDPLRILRTARFAARLHPLGFTIAPETLTRMHAMVDAGEAGHLVPERVWQEMQRALHEPAPGVFFQTLADCGALTVLLPELAAPDRLKRALAALDCVSRTRIIDPDGDGTDTRLAALLSPLSARQCAARVKQLKAPKDCQELAVLTTRTADSLRQSHSAAEQLALLDATDAWRRPNRFQRLLAVCRCIDPALPEHQASALMTAYQTASQVNAKALMAEGFSGKALGEAIRNERLKRMSALNIQTSGK